MKVPFLNLVIQHQSLRDEIREACDRVIGAASFILGPDVQKFEEEFAAYLGVSHCVGLSTGTDALILAFKALDLAPDDEVIIPAHTFVATAIGVVHAGAKAVLVDVDPRNGLIDINAIERAITSKTRAICPVHLYGRGCDMDRLAEIAEKHRLIIVEDAAQAHGARWKGKRLGTFGSLGCFSFYPGKNLGACGDGGAVVTNSPELAARLKRMRNYGSEQKYMYPEWGTNARLDSLQAAILRTKLPHLDSWNRRRYEVATRYESLFRSHSIRDLTIPELPGEAHHCFHLYVVQHPRRDELRKWLADHEIESGIHYPNPYHLEQAFKHLGYGVGSFPISEQLARTVLSLPMFPEITDDQVAAVVKWIAEFR